MSQIHYHYWKWTKPVPIIKSRRKGLPMEAVETVETVEKEVGAYKTCNYNSSYDKKAICNERIANRYMIIQTPINPFISTENYLDDLQVQDVFLRPKDSNIKEVE